MNDQLKDSFLVDGILAFSGYMIEGEEIIGISPLFRKDISSTLIRFFYSIYTHSNQIEVSLSIDQLEFESEEKNKQKLQDFKNEHYQVRKAVEIIIKRK